VVFVDVQLAATGDARTGLDLIRSVAESPGAPMFVIATAFQQHSLEAFDLGVVDYLLKPFSEERVAQCLRRLMVRRPERRPGPLRVVARRKKTLVFLDPQDIWAFEAAERLTSVHSRHGTFDVDLSLAAIEASFGRALTRVHRNWLVKIEAVKEVERKRRRDDAAGREHGRRRRPRARVARSCEGGARPVARERDGTEAGLRSACPSTRRAGAWMQGRLYVHRPVG
jgi:DNA-binding LytR/AlgR family response regulator